MASSRKLISAEADALYQRFRLHNESLLHNAPSVAVAFSGGLDSTVLLHLLARWRAERPLPLSVFHVHHGLSANADAWLAHCAHASAALGLPFSFVRVDLAQVAGEGMEERARAARYAAYAELGVDYVALAHHRDDQVETMLYRLVRGAGVHGAAGMPAIRPLACGQVWRPLLGEPREVLHCYAKHHELHWVEDESNALDVYDRNFLRNRILPQLTARFPAAPVALARAAAHFADAAQLADELAQQDAAGAGLRLPLAALADLSDVRQRNLLRWHLARHAVRPDGQQLADLLRQLLHARDDSMPCVKLGGVALRRYRGELWVSPLAEAAPPRPARAAGGALREAGWLGELQWRDQAGGIRRDWLADIEVRPRASGEVVRTHVGGPARTLKNLFQEAQIPPWLRLCWPLLWRGEVLVAVPGIAVAAEAQAEDGCWPRWQPDDWPDAP